MRKGGKGKKINIIQKKNRRVERFERGIVSTFDRALKNNSSQKGRGRGRILYSTAIKSLYSETNGDRRI